MADRERGRDRPLGHHPSSSSGSGGALSFLPSIFGRRPAPAPAITTRVSTSVEGRRPSASEQRPSFDDSGDARLAASQLMSPDERAGRRPISPAPFDLQAALAIMAPESLESNEVLSQMLKATAVYMANLLITNEDLFLFPSHSKDEAPTPDEIRTLYIRAFHYANPKSEPSVRIAAIRLLAALFATSPPPKSKLQATDLPEHINVSKLYHLVVSSSLPNLTVEEIFVRVGAIKALTRNGSEIDGLEGIVGWLMRMFAHLTDEWTVWCAVKDEQGQEWSGTERIKTQPFAPIRPATLVEVAFSIVDILSSIVSTHIPLFSSSDINRIVQPMLDFLWLGIAASTSENRLTTVQAIIPGSSSRRGSPSTSTINSPIGGHVVGFDSGRPLVNRSRNSTLSSQGTPSPTPTRTTRLTSVSVTATTLLSPTNILSPPPSTLLQPPKWARGLPAFCSFFEMLFHETPIPNDLFDRIMAFICLAFGQDDQEMMPDFGWDATHHLLTLLLGRRGGRRGEQAIRNILEGTVATISNNRTLKMPDEDRKIARGAVIAARNLLHHDDSGFSDRDISLSTLAPSLLAAQSSARASSRPADRAKWQAVDYEILTLLQDHLFHLDSGRGGDEGTGLGDAWTEGAAASEILRGFVPAVLDLKDAQGSRLFSEGGDVNHLLSIFGAVVHQLPAAIGRLYTSSSTAPTFYPPKYIDLLLTLAPTLDEEDATIVLDYYQRECLCLPFTSAWLKNMWKLLNGFYTSGTRLVAMRRRVILFLLRDVYDYAEDLPEHRIELVDQVIVPLLEKHLLDEDDEELVKEALSVLVRAAVAETVEYDDEYGQSKVAVEGEKPDEVSTGTSESPGKSPPNIAQIIESGSFNTMRNIIIKAATQTACQDELSTGGLVPEPNSSRATQPDEESTNLSRKASGRSTSSGLRGLMGTFSPPSRSNELAPISTLSSTSTPVSSEGNDTPRVQNSSPPAATTMHANCKSIQAVSALISIFTRLAFALPHSLSYGSRSDGRTPVSSRIITIYRDLLVLLFPMTNDVPGQPKVRDVKVPARCPRARLVTLQWLMRLRADSKHRIYVRTNPDSDVLSFADTLHRTRERERELRLVSENEARKSRSTQAPRAEEERGRTTGSAERSTRSRSRSKHPPIVKGPDQTYNPLWSVPETISLELPPNSQPSDIMWTYDSSFAALQGKDDNAIEGIWLPVSEYVRVLNGILRGHDWELVSYVLCFLPLQLRNKLFFHGSRSSKEIRALLDVICDGVMNTRSPWEKRFNIPTFITRVKINAVAYESLSILISYRGNFTRDHCERIVQAFAVGLQGRREVAKPCLQALSLCIFELDQYVGRHLLAIVERMKMILSTTAMAVHILEFLIALGQHGTLFRNFTDEQYRLVFAVATGYIGEHNARSDQPTTDKEEYTLSQHVIGLAYYAIYIWFMALKVPQRPAHVSEITRNLLAGRSQRVMVDEMAEVCFDWLARYTYGNADPRPATSFLSEVVMADERESEPPKSQSWLLGGAIITITSHARTGWASIRTIRPTGTNSIVCKLENVPHLDLGEANADLVSLPAVLMANRGGTGPSGEKEKTDDGDLDPKEIVNVQSKTQAPQTFDHTAQHGFIWSGATPSQRRKDVVVEPSYLALQLLSSYPNTSLESPRGRLIPNEEKLMRTLRNIEQTPVIDTLKIAVLYVGPGQTTETEIFSNIDGSPLYLDFLSGLGRLIKLKGQVDIFVGGLNRDNDSDGEYAYAWWDDLTQVIFHTATMMPNLENNPEFSNKKRLVGNDFVKIVYNDGGRDFDFNTIKTSFNLINIVIAPHTPMDWTFASAQSMASVGEEADSEEFFKVTMQRTHGIPEFSPIGEGKIVSRRALPILVRQISQLANDMAARFIHIRDAQDMASAEYITSWRSRLRGIGRVRSSLPAVELPEADDKTAREEMLRDFTRSFSYRPRAGSGVDRE